MSSYNTTMESNTLGQYLRILAPLNETQHINRKMPESFDIKTW